MENLFLEYNIAFWIFICVFVGMSGLYSKVIELILVNL